MANHCKGVLPWKPTWSVVQCFADAAIKACFGEGLLPDPARTESDVYFLYAVNREGPWKEDGSTNIWTNNGKDVELRRDRRGLPGVANLFLQESILSCFGGLRANDDGVGFFPLSKPSILDLAPFIMYGYGNDWFFKDALADRMKSFMDPVFFPSAPPPFDPDILRDDPILARSFHVDWTARLDWAGAVEKLWGGRAAPTKSAALSAALPFCALGQDVPTWIAASLGPIEAGRALSRALAWGNLSAAQTLVATPGLSESDVQAASALARKDLARAHAHESFDSERLAAIGSCDAACEAMILRVATQAPERLAKPARSVSI